MTLEIISPERSLYKGEAEAVHLPGKRGAFTILDRHAPLISTLRTGKIVYRQGKTENECEIESGVVEVKNNVVSICIE